MSASSRTFSTVQAGNCFDNTDRYCALEATACSDPTSFVSARQLQSVPNGHGGNCIKSDFVSAVAVGRCFGNGGDGFCANDPALCAPGMSFAMAVADYSGDNRKTMNCKVSQGGNGLPTGYGRCGMNGNCVWSSNDCNNDETFILDPTCTCDKVITGACEKDGFFYCSVSAYGCDEESRWVSSQQLATETNMDCFLCRSLEDPNASKPVPVFTSSAAPTSSLKSFNRGVLIGGLVGGVIGVLMVAIPIFVVRKRGRVLEQKPTPPSEVDVSCEDVSEIGEFEGTNA